jgi:hypothetical protein
MTQDTFNFSEGKAARDAGLDRAGNPFYRRELLDKARDAARILGGAGERDVTYDDVYLYLLTHGRDPSLLGPAAGKVFLNKDWVSVGWKQSERVSNHARAMRVWRLK